MSKSDPKHKLRVDDQVRANDKAPGDYQGLIGVVVEIGPGKCEYGVRFSDDERGVGYLRSWCLDLTHVLQT